MVSDERTLREHMRLPSYPWGVSRGGTSCDSGMCGVPMLGTARGGVLSGAVCLRGVPSLHVSGRCVRLRSCLITVSGCVHGQVARVSHS